MLYFEIFDQPLFSTLTYFSYTLTFKIKEKIDFLTKDSLQAPTY